jgi:thymidylate kinase
MRIIIFEGMDCIGKTTMIENLVDCFSNIETYHFGKPKGNTNDEKYFYQYGQFDMFYKTLEMFKDTDKTILLDRSHIGEYVWGPVFRNKYPMYLPKLEDEILEKFGEHIHAFLLYSNDIDEIQKRFEYRGEEFPNDWEKVQEMFVDAFQHHTKIPNNIVNLDIAEYEQIITF